MSIQSKALTVITELVTLSPRLTPGPRANIEACILLLREIAAEAVALEQQSPAVGERRRGLPEEPR